MRWIIRIVVIAWALGAGAFYWQIPKQLTEVPTADAIVVFTGGQDRVRAGVDLLNQNNAQMLLISGVRKGVYLFDLVEKTVDPLRVTLGYGARDTRTNVQETKAWVQQHGFKRILLVTAHYHLPRATLLLQDQLPALEIIQYPVITHDFREPFWWLMPKTDWRLLCEYHKYLLTWIQQFWSA